MLIEFSIGNYGSFDKIQTLSFKATGLESASDEVDRSNIVDANGIRYLKIAGLYGANASGKSNFLRGFAYFREMVVHSVQAEGLSENVVNPFRQSFDGISKPSFFQIIFLVEERKYRYGYMLDADGTIASEWLFGPAEKNETYYFKRTGVQVQCNGEWFAEGLDLPQDNLRPDALFLSFCSSYNGMHSKSIRSFLNRLVTVDIGAKRLRRIAVGFAASKYSQTNRLIESGQEKLVLRWFKEAGLPYTGIRLPEDERFPSTVFLTKNIYDDRGAVIGQTEMELERDESEGTKKFYGYIGKLYRKFKEGGLYVVDEIDSNFHPSLLQKLVRLFQNKEINVADAQLLFTSHDTTLMDPKIMRRDQFYFAEKTLHEATKLYSLADLKGIRNNSDFARQYLAGMYGALPILGDFLEEIEEEFEQED